jgi:hypothetical protein
MPEARGFLDLLYSETARHILPLDRLQDLVARYDLHVEERGLYPWCPTSTTNIDKVPPQDRQALKVEFLDQLSLAAELSAFSLVHRELFSETWEPCQFEPPGPATGEERALLCAAEGKYLNKCSCWRQPSLELDIVHLQVDDTFPRCPACGEVTAWARVGHSGERCSVARRWLSTCSCHRHISLRPGETFPPCPGCKAGVDWAPLS